MIIKLISTRNFSTMLNRMVKNNQHYPIKISSSDYNMIFPQSVAHLYSDLKKNKKDRNKVRLFQLMKYDDQVLLDHLISLDTLQKHETQIRELNDFLVLTKNITGFTPPQLVSLAIVTKTMFDDKKSHDWGKVISDMHKFVVMHQSKMKPTLAFLYMKEVTSFSNAPLFW